MSTKFELADYCANLISIMVSKESAGLPRGRSLAHEYERAYAELREILNDEELEHEARKSK